MDNCTSFNYSQAYSINPTLQYVAGSYREAHKYVALIICTYGIVTNIINILVLTKSSMRNSINCLLTGIAVADIITMTSYIPFVYFYYFLDGTSRVASLPWNTFFSIHMNLTMTSHTASIWLGVTMAAMRYFFVRPTARGAQTVDCRTTLIIIFFTFIGAAIMIVPNWLASDVISCYQNKTGLVEWHIKLATFSKNEDDILQTLTFLIFPIVGKIVPVFMISIFGVLLLLTLRDASQRSKRLRGNSMTSQSNSSCNSQAKRTTSMLLAIIALFIISEIPQSILLLLSIILDGFFVTVYSQLGDFIDLLSLINNAFKFTTYITMSTQFRKTLMEMGGGCLHHCGHQTARENTKYALAQPASV